MGEKGERDLSGGDLRQHFDTGPLQTPPPPQEAAQAVSLRTHRLPNSTRKCAPHGMVFAWLCHYLRSHIRTEHRREGQAAFTRPSSTSTWKKGPTPNRDSDTFQEEAVGPPGFALRALVLNLTRTPLSRPALAESVPRTASGSSPGKMGIRARFLGLGDEIRCIPGGGEHELPQPLRSYGKSLREAGRCAASRMWTVNSQGLAKTSNPSASSGAEGTNKNLKTLCGIKRQFHFLWCAFVFEFINTHRQNYLLPC